VFDLGVIPVVAGIAGLVTGFIEGFFGPMGTLWKAMKSGADKFFKAIKWSLTPVGKVYTSIKSWFNTKITLGWTKFADMVKDSKIGAWYRSVRGWMFDARRTATGRFGPSRWTSFKALFTESKVAGWIKSVKAWFKGGLGKGSILTKISNFCNIFS
jgi:hypothetical protein